MTVYFVKLRNGEEVIAETYRNHKDIVMTNPMSLEYGGETSEGKKMIFMTRYNPFCKDKTIRMPRHLVAYMGPVTPEVEDYYSSSLDYCKQVMDKNFSRGMKSAAQQTHDALKEEEEIPSLDLTELPAPDTTIH